jgi:hypothetical protein
VYHNRSHSSISSLFHNLNFWHPISDLDPPIHRLLLLYQCFVGLDGQPLLVTAVVDVEQPTWQLMQPPGVCRVVVVGQHGSKHGRDTVWTVTHCGAGGQVAELNPLPQKAIKVMLDISKRTNAKLNDHRCHGMETTREAYNCQTEMSLEGMCSRNGGR